MPRILCFGDSNTHGTAPMATRDANVRLTNEQRWPSVMARQLGPDWDIIEEGLPGRTTSLDDPIMGQHMNGQTGLRIALGSHQPIDVLAIMLGTNDLKTRFAPNPQRVTSGMASLLDIALHPDIHNRHGGYQVIVIAPPPVFEAGCLAAEFYGGSDVQLSQSYSELCKVRGCAFLDAGEIITCDPVDGVHFNADAHAKLGRAMVAMARTAVS